MRLNQDLIQRMFDGRGGTSGGGSSLDPGLINGLATQMWTEENYVSKTFFNELFIIHKKTTTTVYDGDTVVSTTTETSGTFAPNEIPSQEESTDSETGYRTVVVTEVDNIEAKKGLWTDFFLSALGLNGSGGGGGIGDVTWQALGDNTDTRQIASSHLTTALSSALAGYATQSWVTSQNYVTSSAISDMATKTWVNNQNFVNWTALGDTTTTQQIALSHLTTALSGYATQTWVTNNFSTPSSVATQMQTYAKIQNGTITIGDTSLTPITSVSGTFWGKSFTNGGTVNGTIKAGSNGGAIEQFHSVEMNSAGTLAGYGGFIDFHYYATGSTFDSSLDYTLRIIESEVGVISILAKNNNATNANKLAGLLVGDGYDGSYVQIGNIRIVYDSTNNALKVVKLVSGTEVAANFYATGSVSALGYGSGGGGGTGDVTWTNLADNTDTRQIALSHLTGALAGYATTSQLAGYLLKSGGTMSGNITFPVASAAYDAYGVYWGGQHIGSDTSGNLALYATADVRIRPNTGDGYSYGLEIAKNKFTYNGYGIWHAGNFTPGSYVAKAGDTMSGALMIRTDAEALYLGSSSISSYVCTLLQNLNGGIWAVGLNSSGNYYIWNNSVSTSVLQIQKDGSTSITSSQRGVLSLYQTTTSTSTVGPYITFILNGTESGSVGYNHTNGDVFLYHTSSGNALRVTASGANYNGYGLIDVRGGTMTGSLTFPNTEGAANNSAGVIWGNAKIAVSSYEGMGFYASNGLFLRPYAYNDSEKTSAGYYGVVIKTDQFTYNTNTIYHSGNFTPSNYVSKSGDTMTGALTITDVAASLTLGSSSSSSYVCTRYINSYGRWTNGALGGGAGYYIYSSVFSGNVLEIDGYGRTTLVSSQRNVLTLSHTTESTDVRGSYISFKLNGAQKSTVGYNSSDGTFLADIDSSNVLYLKFGGAYLGQNRIIDVRGGTMTGSLTFSAASAAYNSEGVKWSSNSRIGADTGGRIAIYSVANILLRPNIGDGYTFGVDITKDSFTYNSNTIWHAGNLTPSDYLAKSGGTMTGNITFTNRQTLAYESPGLVWGTYNKIAASDSGDLGLYTYGTFYIRPDVSNGYDAGLIISRNGMTFNGYNVLHANNYSTIIPTRNLRIGGTDRTVYSPYTTAVNLDTTYLRLSGDTMTGSINLPNGTVISNGSTADGNWMLAWNGTGTILGAYQGPTYVRSSAANSLYHRVGASTDYLILDANNYSSYALPLSGGTMTGSITMTTNSSSAIESYGYLFSNGSRIGSSTAGAIGIYGYTTAVIRTMSSLSYGIVVGNGTTSITGTTTINGESTFSGVLNITGSTSFSEGIRIHDYGSISSVWFRCSSASGYDAGMWGISANSNGLRFRGPASTSGTSANDYLNILHGGNVGIGTTSPEYKLHVLGNILVTGSTHNATGHHIQIGTIRIIYVASENALKIQNEDGTAANLYATGGISALGYQSGGGGGGSTGVFSTSITPDTTGTYDLGTSTYKWRNLYLAGANGGNGFSIITSYSRYVYIGSLNKIIFGADVEFEDTAYVENRMGIGVKNGNYDLYVYGENEGNAYFAGDVSVASLTNRSDMRLKDVVGDVNLSVQQIASAPAFKFRFKEKAKRTMVGTSAQYWDAVLPESVTRDADGILGLDYGVTALVSTIILAKGMTEHERRITKLEMENAELRARIKDLEEN